jgi:DNA-binding beta-propeller fold protein YncE
VDHSCKLILPFSDSPRGIAFGADGKLYVSDTTANAIQRFDPATGGYLGVFAFAGGAPIGITFGPDGDLYAAIASSRQAPDGHVERFNPANGQSLGVFGPTNFNNPQALTFGPDNNLYVHIQSDHKIVKLDGITGQSLGNFVNETSPYNPACGLVFGPDGNLYTGNLTVGGKNDGVRRYNGTTGAFIDNFVPGDGTFWSTGLAFKAVPEPTSLVLAVIAFGGLLFAAWRRRALDRLVSIQP